MHAAGAGGAAAAAAAAAPVTAEGMWKPAVVRFAAHTDVIAQYPYPPGPGPVVANSTIGGPYYADDADNGSSSSSSSSSSADDAKQPHQPQRVYTKAVAEGRVAGGGGGGGGADDDQPPEQSAAARAARIDAYVRAHRLVVVPTASIAAQPTRGGDAVAVAPVDGADVHPNLTAAAAGAGAGRAAAAVAATTAAGTKSLVTRYALDVVSATDCDSDYVYETRRTRALLVTAETARRHAVRDAALRGGDYDTGMMSAGPLPFVQARAVVTADHRALHALVMSVPRSRERGDDIRRAEGALHAHAQTQVLAITRVRYAWPSDDTRMRRLMTLARAEQVRVDAAHAPGPVYRPPQRPPPPPPPPTSPAPEYLQWPQPALHLKLSAAERKRHDGMCVTTVGVPYSRTAAAAAATAAAAGGTSAALTPAELAFAHVTRNAAQALQLQRDLALEAWRRLNPQLNWQQRSRVDTPPCLEPSSSGRPPSSRLPTMQCHAHGTGFTHTVQALCWVPDTNAARDLFGADAFDATPTLVRDGLDVVYAQTFGATATRGVVSGRFSVVGGGTDGAKAGVPPFDGVGTVDGTAAAQRAGQEQWRAHRDANAKLLQQHTDALGVTSGWILCVSLWRVSEQFAHAGPTDRIPGVVTRDDACNAGCQDDDPWVTPEFQYFRLLDPVTGATRSVPTRMRTSLCGAAFGFADAPALPGQSDDDDTWRAGFVHSAALVRPTAGGSNKGELWVTASFPGRHGVNGVSSGGVNGVFVVRDGAWHFACATPEIRSAIVIAPPPAPAPDSTTIANSNSAPMRVAAVTGTAYSPYALMRLDMPALLDMDVKTTNAALVSGSTSDDTTTNTATTTSARSTTMTGTGASAAFHSAAAAVPRLALPGAAYDASAPLTATEQQRVAQGLLDDVIAHPLWNGPVSNVYGGGVTPAAAQLERLDRLLCGALDLSREKPANLATDTFGAEAVARAMRHAADARSGTHMPRKVLRHPSGSSRHVFVAATPPGGYYAADMSIATALWQVELPVDGDELRAAIAAADPHGHTFRHVLPREVWALVTAYAAQSEPRAWAHFVPAHTPRAAPAPGALPVVGAVRDSVVQVIDVLPNPASSPAERWCEQCGVTRVVHVLAAAPNGGALYEWVIPDRAAAAGEDLYVDAAEKTGAAAAARGSACDGCNGRALIHLAGATAAAVPRKHVPTYDHTASEADDVAAATAVASDDGPVRDTTRVRISADSSSPTLVVPLHDLLLRQRTAAAGGAAVVVGYGVAPLAAMPGVTAATTHVLFLGSGTRMRRVPLSLS